MKKSISSLQKATIIEKWKTSSSSDFAYFDSVENKHGVFWEENHIYRQKFNELDTHTTLEIACGKGRHAAQVVGKCERLYLVDTSIDALQSTRERFKDFPHVSVHLSEDGETLPFLSDASITAVFSYDAMVHFELLTMAAYLGEIARVLKPGGRALLHHSNYSNNPTGRFTDNPGWRNFMSKDVMAHLASRAELRMLDCLEIDWSAPKSDALSLLEKPA